MTDEPSILTVMADFLAANPPQVRQGLHVAEPVWQFFRATYMKVARPEPANALLGLPIVVDDYLTGRQWEIHENGHVVKSGDMAPAPQGMTIVYDQFAGWLAIDTELLAASVYPQPGSEGQRSGTMSVGPTS